MNKEKRNHNEFRIVALMAEISEDKPIIFVGQSKMCDLQKLFFYFKNEGVFTKDFFKQGVTAELFLLEDQWLSKEGAYLHRIAWMRYFFEKDYDVVGDLKSYEKALNLHGVAAGIYHELSKISLEEVLQRRHTSVTKILDYKKASEMPPTKKPGPLIQRLSIRLSTSEYDAFSAYCDKNGMTQREGLQMLLSKTSNNEEYALSFTMEQHYRIQKLAEENAKLKKKNQGVFLNTET